MNTPERPLLAIDSSTSLASIAIGGRNGVLAEVSLSSPVGGKKRGTRRSGGHSSVLLPSIEFAIRSVGLEPADLGGVVVGEGPGSFTGLRIAGATAKGIVAARGIPLFAFSSLLAVATQAWASDGPVYAIFDARGRDVYAACYRFHCDTVETIRDPAATTVDEIIEDLGSLAKTLLLGDGAVRHRSELEAAGGVVGAAQHGTPRAVGLLWLVTRAPDAGRVEDAAAWEPVYLRASGAERIAADKGRKASA
ncbi:MAG: tRNA (adenosine(37)-N6)-threonylcarbamoyltransferase complex dimerization subunit type 1 TsaB [Gemmatimonadota bacterium]